jgi:Asp-tRNA(Asn)/Glu-tRNA(Gln) amidotransferase C subunit
MISGDFHIMAKGAKGYVCEVLQKKGAIDRRIGLSLIEEFLKTEKHVSVLSFQKTLKQKGIEITEESLEKFKQDISSYKNLNDKINEVNVSDITRPKIQRLKISKKILDTFIE